MADQQESNPVEGGAVDPGQEQQASQSKGVQQPSVDVDAVAAFFETEAGKDLLQRQTQSVKDRRFAEQEKALTSFEEQLGRMTDLMKNQGLSQQQAIDRMSLEDRLNQLEQQTGLRPEASEPSQGKQSPQINVEAFFNAVGIDPNSPSVTEFYKQGEITPDRLINFVSTVKGKSTPPASPAQAQPVGGGQTVPARDANSINRELVTLLEKVPKSSEDYKKIKSLRQELSQASAG